MSNPSAAGTENRRIIEMFDRLIESDTAGADRRNRSRYFLVSTVVVGVLFVTAVVYSLYAAEVALGSDSFDFAELTAPPDPGNKPQTKQANEPQQTSTHKSQHLIRHQAVARTDEPTIVPTGVSSDRSGSLSRPDWPYEVNRGLPEGGFGSPVGIPGPGDRSVASSIRGSGADPEQPADPDPPPAKKTESSPKHIKVSDIVNGNAIYLPKPPYSAVARSLGLHGDVSVQVTIDENGDVVSAKAVKGHPFFVADAERAARAAKFKPTVLNGNAVKVTGVIVYKFARN